MEGVISLLGQIEGNGWMSPYRTVRTGQRRNRRRDKPFVCIEPSRVLRRQEVGASKDCTNSTPQNSIVLYSVWSDWALVAADGCGVRSWIRLLQRPGTVPYCILQLITVHCGHTKQYTAAYYSTLWAYYNTLWHTTIHCSSTLQLQ